MDLESAKQIMFNFGARTPAHPEPMFSSHPYWYRGSHSINTRDFISAAAKHGIEMDVAETNLLLKSFCEQTCRNPQQQSCIFHYYDAAQS